MAASINRAVGIVITWFKEVRQLMAELRAVSGRYSERSLPRERQGMPPKAARRATKAIGPIDMPFVVVVD